MEEKREPEENFKIENSSVPERPDLVNGRNLNDQIHDLELKLLKYPEGYLVYKTIKGNKQPYLQWKEDGKTKSRYVKQEDRAEILKLVEERSCIMEQLNRLQSYRKAIADSWKKYTSLKKQTCMGKKISIGYQSFAEMREKDFFYIDKSMLIEKWWNDPAQVTLITRPRRFGKTLNMDMIDCFFSVRYEGRADLFEDMQIWDEAEIRKMQGIWPVIFISFAGVKSGDVADQKEAFRLLIIEQVKYYQQFSAKYDNRTNLSEEWNALRKRIESGTDLNLALAIHELSGMLYRIFGKKVLILIDEYDTPMQEAWLCGKWEKARPFYRMLYNNTLKTNPFLEKALITGIARVSVESMFSDLNNIRVSDMDDESYEDCYGFTEEEVLAAMDSQGLTDKEQVKEWYNGFCIGKRNDIYNPWSVINYLQSGSFKSYWVNTSSNQMINDLIRLSSPEFKKEIGMLMQEKNIFVQVESEIAFSDLQSYPQAIWGLFWCSGYLKKVNREKDTGTECSLYKGIYNEDEMEYGFSCELAITNREVSLMLRRMTKQWFSGVSVSENYLDFWDAAFSGDAETMEETIADVFLEMISYFDAGGGNSVDPENFYHGFFLGMLSTLQRDYYITSNRESGRGRYDIMAEPKDPSRNALIMEFKVRRARKEATLEDTAAAAIEQIEKKKYDSSLKTRGFSDEQIMKYGIAFDGKEVCVRRKE